MKDPQAVLTEAGIHVKGKVHVHQSTDADHHLVIPKRPDSLDEHVRKQKEKPGAMLSRSATLHVRPRALHQ